MGKAIQIRNVPDDVHRVMRARAAEAGLSLSDYLLLDLERRARRPDPSEVIARILRRPAIEDGMSPTDVIRELRDSG